MISDLTANNGSMFIDADGTQYICSPTNTIPPCPEGYEDMVVEVKYIEGSGFHAFDEDGEDLTPYIIMEQRKQRDAAIRTLAERQQRVKAAMPERVASGVVPVMQIDPLVYKIIDEIEQETNGAKPGECWQDDEFCRDYIRDNPELATTIKPKTNYIQVPEGYEGKAASD